MSDSGGPASSSGPASPPPSPPEDARVQLEPADAGDEPKPPPQSSSPPSPSQSPSNRPSHAPSVAPSEADPDTEHQQLAEQQLEKPKGKKQRSRKESRDGDLPLTSKQKKLVAAKLGFFSEALHRLPRTMKDTLRYTFAYWIKWHHVETIADQLLLFGDLRNMPALIRNHRLGAIVDGEFRATEFDPREAGDRWCLLVVTNDGSFSNYRIGYSSRDLTGAPSTARNADPESGEVVTNVRTEFASTVQIRRLVTTTRGAGLIAQAWIWPRDLEEEEIMELWVATKDRYLDKEPVPTDEMIPKQPAPNRGRDPPLPWDSPDPIIDKDNAAMLDIPLVSKILFQRLKNVFTVLVDYANYSDSFLVIDRIHNPSATAELLLEVALRANGSNSTVLVMDARARLETANVMLQQLIDCGFLVDQEEKYKPRPRGLDKVQVEEQRLTEFKLTSTDFASPRCDLRRLVTPAGLAWLRASQSELAGTIELINSHSRHLDMCRLVTNIFSDFQCSDDLRPDGRPRLDRIWKVFYNAQLFASGTHYIVFDDVEVKGKRVIDTLGTLGTIYLNGSTEVHKKIIDCVQAGSPILLLESTGGVTQAFSHAVKAVKMMKSKWPLDFVLRLVTEYKQRVATNQRKDKLPTSARPYALDNVHLLDKELVRMDLILSSGEYQEPWMRNFGLPEVMLLFETWQRSPDFLLKSIVSADVMRFSAEALLDLFTACFSGGAGGIPELGLGNAETKVVATAWNRHLILFNNSCMYCKRSWTMQFVLYFLSQFTVLLSIITSSYASLQSNEFLSFLMQGLPITVALLGTISTRLRQPQKYSVSRMASMEIVSEIYKYRTRSLEYDGLALAAALKAAQEGPADAKKKKGEEGLAMPIPAKEKNKLARKVFVERVQAIYSHSLTSEMSKGTSASHKTNGMDPSQLVVDADEEGQGSIMNQLQQHVCNKLYFITVREWALTAEEVKRKAYAVEERRGSRLRDARRKASKKLSLLLAVVITVLIAAVRFVFAIGRGAALLCSPSRMNKFVKQQRATNGNSAAEARESSETRTSLEMRLIRDLKARGDRLRGIVTEVSSATTGLPVKEEEMPEQVAGGRTERLDTSFIEAEEGGSGGGGGGGGGRASDDGGGERLPKIRDDLMTAMSIDDYMMYRARPICTYMMRTAPWRAFELQCLEIFTFIFQSSGAVLVSIGPIYVPYVALTIGVASVAKSFIEFSRLNQQVEAYNSAQRNIHNMINAWDGMTRTQRRTRKTITQVVQTVETALLTVTTGMTDSTPGQAFAMGSEEEGEAEGAA